MYLYVNTVKTSNLYMQLLIYVINDVADNLSGQTSKNNTIDLFYTGI